MSEPINITDGIPSEIYVAIGRGRYDNAPLYELARDVADVLNEQLAAAQARNAKMEAEIQKLREELALNWTM